MGIPSAARLAAIGLATAGLTILVLAFLIVSDLTREDALHRQVISVQREQDGLDMVRIQINELVGATRLAAATGTPANFRAVEKRSADLDARLVALRSGDASIPALDALAPQVGLLIVHARSVAPIYVARGAAAAAAAARETEVVAGDAGVALERSLAALTTNVNERSLDRIRVGDRLRRYVGWFVAGSVVVLIALFAAFRRAQRRERAALQRIEWLAHFDSITALPNRALLADRLAQEAIRGRRHGERFALVLFDLDGFKDVNDTWGHAAGDRLLALVAERSRKCMRASDTVGRLGGDEFMAILPHTDVHGAMHLAEKLRLALAEPFALDDGAVQIGASLGISVFPDHGQDAEGLQRAADGALYHAKRDGKDCIRVAGGKSAADRAILATGS